MSGYWIIGSVEATIAYETWLAQFILRRIQMFDDPQTFWGKYRSSLMDMERNANFPSEAYYPYPADPFVTMPDWYSGVHILRRRYLNRLRMRLLKRARQEGWIRP